MTDTNDFGLGALQAGLLKAADWEQSAIKEKLAEGQKKFEKMKSDRKMYLDLSGNREYAPEIRTRFYNNAVKLDHAIEKNSDIRLPAIERFDDGVAMSLDAFKVIDENEGLTPEEKMRLKREVIIEQAKKTSDLSKTQFLTSLATPAPTEGQKVSDKKFAEDYNDFATQGGAFASAANLQKLDDALASLKDMSKSIGLGQRAASVLPDSVRGILTPQYKSIEQDIRTNVLGLLRQALGPQFTEKEGERIFSQVFDPSLPPETNLTRAVRLRESLAAALASKQDAAQYYEEHGTLAGFKPAKPAIPSGPTAPKQNPNGHTDVGDGFSFKFK